MNPAEFANIAAAEQDFWWYRGMRSVLFRLLDPVVRGRRIRRVLEAGCGTGYFAQLLERRYGWQTYPMDLARQGLMEGRRLGVARLVQADATSMPFPDGTFDAAISLDLMVHMGPGEENRPVADMARVLKRGGLFVLRAAAFKALRSRHSEFVCERQRYSRGRLVRLARGHGIRVTRATYVNTLLLPVALAKFRLWEPLMGGPASSGLAPVAPWLNRALYAPLALEAAWLGRGLNLPVGQSVVVIGEKT